MTPLTNKHLHWYLNLSSLYHKQTIRFCDWCPGSEDCSDWLLIGGEIWNSITALAWIDDSVVLLDVNIDISLRRCCRDKIPAAKGVWTRLYFTVLHSLKQFDLTSVFSCIQTHVLLNLTMHNVADGWKSLRKINDVIIDSHLWMLLDFPSTPNKTYTSSTNIQTEGHTILYLRGQGPLMPDLPQVSLFIIYQNIKRFSIGSCNKILNR